MKKTGLQLRCLIRNAEARIEHMTDTVNRSGPGDFLPSDYYEQTKVALAKLENYRREFRALTTLPAAPFLATAIPTVDVRPLVTSKAQPASSS